ncbi:MAG: OmpA family protein [Treponema sp.]|jgi:outer membrane protein OmpA-like peptidoglycan-associated protein|nr:OmpA family protein [Treponema sp.]
MKRYLFILIFFQVSLLFSQEGKLFRFNHQKGDSASYISTVEEEVFVNGYLNHQSEIINRISSTVTDTNDNGDGFINASYMTTENTISNYSNQYLSWGEEFSSTFTRKNNGELTISDDLFMPTVRNVPVFSDKQINKGESWTADGKEVHDLRTAFNMDSPLIIPFTATYNYLEDKEINGEELSIISVKYEFSFINNKKAIQNGSSLYSSKGYSNQILYWNNKKGILETYSEDFQIQLTDIDNNVFTFRGNAHAEVTEFKSVNDEENVKKIQDSVENLNLNNISVSKGEKGLIISLDNIQFEPDSDILLNSEKIKLQEIAKILQEYTNDLLITGHCAARGSEKARQALSEERAASVASYLKELGIRDEYHIFTQGKGSTEPVASNDTEEGREKNRRVEITILN